MIRFSYLLLMVILVSGCSFPKIYKNNYDKNLTINLKTNQKDGFFTSTEYYFGVNDLNKKCEVDYKGQLELEAGTNKIGIKPNQFTFLLINVYTDMGNSGSSFKSGALLYPRPGIQYIMDVDYLDEMMDIRLYQVKGGKKRKLKVLPISSCKPQ